MDYLNKLKDKVINNNDFIFKEIKINNKLINIISIETITNGNDINDFILKKISNFDSDNNLYESLYNKLPLLNVIKITSYNDMIYYLMNAYTIIYFNDLEILGIETINSLSRSISESDYEKTITGPKDSFIEHFNTNVGLIRKRIKNVDLCLENIFIGKYSNTKVGVMYINSICKLENKDKIINKLKNINIDGIIDSSYIRKNLNDNKSLFPTIRVTERPDIVSQALLEGKIIIITDNSPNILILPTFFIDYFHMSDDYYQKNINVSFIRLIRLIAFIIAIFLPSYYIAITTYNVDFIPINLLINFISQRSSVPFPAFMESLLMIISFEILRESDTRIPSSMGTAISILGGLVLGDALVTAGIVSPIMIIVIAISAISGLVFQSIEVINAIRWWRFLLIILSSLFGLYGIFVGIILILINLSDTETFDKDYLYPFAPINFEEQKDGFVKINNGNIKYRNPILSNNKIRGVK